MTEHEMQVLRNIAFSMEELLCDRSYKNFQQASLALAQVTSVIAKREGDHDSENSDN